METGLSRMYSSTALSVNCSSGISLSPVAKALMSIMESNSYSANVNCCWLRRGSQETHKYAILVTWLSLHELKRRTQPLWPLPSAQHLAEYIAIDVPTTKDCPHTLAASGSVLQQRCHADRTGTFGYIVRIDEVGAHRILHRIVIDH